MKTLLLDNYDSFSRILFQYLWEVNGEKPLFVRNDEWTLEQLRAARFDNIVISPGPGHPGSARDFGICAQVLRTFPHVPVLGVCLGLQGLGLIAGGDVVSAPAVRHGKTSPIRHDGEGVFESLPQSFQAVRYHSLVIDPASCPAALIVSATAADDGQIMGIRFADKPWHGVQFHPESIGTDHGKALLANFRALSEAHLQGLGRKRGPGMPHALGRPAGSPETGIEIERPATAFSDAATVELPRPRPAGLPARVLEARELPWRDPERVFERLFENAPAAFWLDSLAEPVPGEARITYMGSGARLIEAASGEDPFSIVDAHLRKGVTCKLPETLRFPGSFRGGLVGWFAYELKRFADGESLPGTPLPDLPEALFLEPDRMLAFDAAARRVVAFLPLGADGGPSPAARAWLASLDETWRGIATADAGAGRTSETDLGSAAGRSSGTDLSPTAGPGDRADSPADFGSALRLPWKLSADRDEYLARIRSLQQAILRGETYEACLTNEWRVRADVDPFEVYRRLRRANPAPYAAYLRFPQARVLSASPERFLKLDASGGLACRPIKGTRPRGIDAAQDRALRDDLACNDKDRSENLMIVDLVRNDFGKVCELGSVRAPELMKVEPHPTVFQLVSTVMGRLAPDRGAIDAVRACFPGGSMTGAPKRRTMELLEAAERRPRGVFSGAFGYLGWDGAMDLGMVIRTLIHKDGEYRVGCGGAILAESDPQAEFAEAMLKAKAQLLAVEAVFAAQATRNPQTP